MSGYERPRGIATQRRLQLTRVRAGAGLPAVVEGINGALTVIEGADQQNLKRGEEPAFDSIILRSPAGKTFRVHVDDTGALATYPVMTRS